MLNNHIREIFARHIASNAGACKKRRVKRGLCLASRPNNWQAEHAWLAGCGGFPCGAPVSTPGQRVLMNSSNGSLLQRRSPSRVVSKRGVPEYA